MWIGNDDVGDRVAVDWTDTSIVSVRASDQHDVDAIAVTVVAGLVARRRPGDLPVLLIGDRDASTLLGLLSELPHVGGRLSSGDAFERRQCSHACNTSPAMARSASCSPAATSAAG